MANATKKGTLAKLAGAELKKTDDQRSLDMLNDLVEENENAMRNEIFEAKKVAKAAAKFSASLEANVNATAADIITAERNVALTAKTVEDMQTIIDRRF